jgi:hypothetical protein
MAPDNRCANSRSMPTRTPEEQAAVTAQIMRAVQAALAAHRADAP